MTYQEIFDEICTHAGTGIAMSFAHAVREEHDQHDTRVSVGKYEEGQPVYFQVEKFMMGFSTEEEAVFAAKLLDYVGEINNTIRILRLINSLLGKGDYKLID